ncbi:uncharacterized protein LOC120354885 [Nilaparvata lugens]|uniref:uncharacterized protein LOC120354885 n=1 Tax=Nilaparvata lugens TaxID=108931 RepID=UPI00193DDE0D|nr:uncharacterized protein LOC120354885 [Nilaparvata lugens]
MLRLLLACQIFFFCLFCTDGKLQLSETKKYLEFNSGQSFELTCIGPPTKQWNYPRMQFLDSSTGSTEIPNVIIHQRANNSEVSILTVQNASYLDTGAYKCSNSNGTSFENVEIYVFVRGE